MAIKLVRRADLADATTRRRFRREARLAAAVSHRSIVQIFDIVEDPSGDAIVMELVEGTTLAERLRCGTLAPAEICAHGRDVALGLASAHDRGLVHRDLKSENLMLTADGDIKILDFGIARYSDDATRGSTLTAAGAIVGSCHAMSPEQALGHPVDAALTSSPSASCSTRWRRACRRSAPNGRWRAWRRRRSTGLDPLGHTDRGAADGRCPSVAEARGNEQVAV